MRKLIALQMVILGLFVLLGNGIRSIGTMSVSISQSDFASFLNISVEKTDVLVELLLGGAVIALALAPFSISLATARRVAVAAALLTSACYAAIGITMHVDPALDVREIVVIAGFALGGFSVAFFAPLAQLSITLAESDRQKSLLTTIWTAAQPIAFLIAPQMVRFVAYDIGIGNYFLLLAAMPLVLLLFVPLVFRPAAILPEPARAAVDFRPVALFILVILLFEAWTTANSFVGIASLLSLGLLAAFLAMVAFIFSRRRSLVPNTDGLPKIALFLLLVLFILELPTTGLYETAFLVRHLCASELIADRATLGAAAQVASVFGTGALLARWPGLRNLLLGLSILLLAIGAVLTLFYPYQGSEVALYYWSKLISAAGMGMATTVIVAAVAAVSAGNRVVMLAPAFVIMFGTEVGIELMEIVYQTAKLSGLDEVSAYQGVFYAQVAAMLVAAVLAATRGLGAGGLAKDQALPARG